MRNFYFFAYLIVTLLTGSAALAEASECSSIQNTIANCAAQNRGLEAGALKATCETPIKAFIKIYDGNVCRSEMVFGAQEITLQEAVQALISEGYNRQVRALNEVDKINTTFNSLVIKAE